MFIHGPRCLLDLELTLTRLVVVACTLLAQVVPRLGHWDEVVMLDEDDVALREARRPSHLPGRPPQSARGCWHQSDLRVPCGPGPLDWFCPITCSHGGNFHLQVPFIFYCFNKELAPRLQLRQTVTRPPEY